MSIFIQLASAAGQLLVPRLEFNEAEYSLVENEIGVLSVTGPLSYPLGYFQRDGQLFVRRSVYGGSAYLEGNAVWLLSRVEFATSERGARSYQLRAVHANALLARRIVDYVAGSSQSSKSGPADDVIKAVIAENFISPTNAARVMAGLSVGPNLGAAPAISKAFAWRNVLEVIRDLCADAAASGVYLGVEVVPASGGFQVATYTGQRGVDRRNDQAALFSQERGNLAGASLTYDYEAERNAITAGGQGEGADRILVRVASGAAGASAYARGEAFAQANQASTTAAVQAEADAALWRGRARVRFSGAVQQVPGSLYGINYGWGDIVPASYAGLTIPCRIARVVNRVGRDGEQLDIRLSNDDVI